MIAAAIIVRRIQTVVPARIVVPVRISAPRTILVKRTLVSRPIPVAPRTRVTTKMHVTKPTRAPATCVCTVMDVYKLIIARARINAQTTAATLTLVAALITVQDTEISAITIPVPHMIYANPR